MQAAAAQRVRSPAPVVGDADHERSVVAPELDGRLVRARVLGDVGQPFRDQEVGRGLDVGAEAAVLELEPHRQRGVRGQILERGGEAVVGEHGGIDPGGEVAQVADRAAGLLGRGVQRRRGHVAARLLDPHQRLHEPLLRTVVEVAPDPPALLGRGADEPRAGGGDLLGARLLGDRAGVRGLGLQALGDVAEDDHAPSGPRRSPAARRSTPPAPSTRRAARTSPARPAPSARSCAPAAAGTPRRGRACRRRANDGSWSGCRGRSAPRDGRSRARRAPAGLIRRTSPRGPTR